MKLKHFNTANLPKQERGAPYLHLNSKTGLIRITDQAAARIGLKPGDKVAFAQDEEESGDWYLYKDPEGFEIRDGNKDNNTYGLLFNSTAAVRLVFDSVDFKGTSGRLMVAVAPFFTSNPFNYGNTHT